jgi:type I site-specific restriction-modification system R (restriction) subunit
VGVNPVGQFSFGIGSKATNIRKNRNEKAALALGEDHAPAPKDDEAPVPAVLPILLRGMCLPATLLDLVENFRLFDRGEGEPLKIAARNHQELAKPCTNSPIVETWK